MRIELLIEGMTCENCQKFVREALEGCTNVDSATVDLRTNRAVVEGDDIDAAELIDAVEEEGYGATVARLAKLVSSTNEFRSSTKLNRYFHFPIPRDVSKRRASFFAGCPNLLLLARARDSFAANRCRASRCAGALSRHTVSNACQTVLWDEPVKAAFSRLCESLEASGEIAPARAWWRAFTIPIISPSWRFGGERPAFVVLRHNDGDTRGLWSAAGELSALFGAEVVPSHRDFTRDGVRFRKAARAYPGGTEALLNQETDAPLWRALVHTEPHPLIAAEVRV
jgi:copper chaperone CopZ